MQYNVSSFLREHTGATREYDVDDEVTVDGVRRHLAGRVRMDRTPDGILVRAELLGSLETECSRCLRPARLPVTIAFEEEYVPTVDVFTGARLPAPEGREDAYEISERHILDLELPVQQYWAVAVPMAPLCREDCPGLCPVCGEDVSSREHSCTPDEIDARWTKLEELKAAGN